MSFENPEKEAGTKSNNREAYFRDLLESEHIIEIKEGENLDLQMFQVVPDAPEANLMGEVVESIVRYLNFPLVQDDFENHTERIEWYRSTKLLGKYDERFYFENKLRLNKIRNPLSFIKHLISDRTKRRLNRPAFFDEIEPKVIAFRNQFPVYGIGTVDENVAYVESLEILLKKVLNALIDHGLVIGERV